MATARKTAPVAAEASKTPDARPVPFRGHVYHVLPTTEWPYDALVAFEDGRIASLLRLILVDGDHEKLLEAKLKVGEIREFISAMQGSLGIEGN
ncbi:hypothetical protein [Pseudoclavibacter sp. RFBA6]|uniref:hypothetical protein n=1 Tax=Pseudoclavibacter sp. RFBA6 TaxID=2080573 RepID=UPI0011AFE33E|nr:hypothetical protein [Pseudoclavibacter sp. RFBA6]